MIDDMFKKREICERYACAYDQADDATTEALERYVDAANKKKAARELYKKARDLAVEKFQALQEIEFELYGEIISK